MFKTMMITVTLLLVCGNSWAHHPSGGGATGQAGPVTTVSASTLSKGKLAFSLQTEYTDFDTFSDEELRGFAEAGKDAHTFDSLFHVFAGAAYGVTDDLTLGLKIPYVILNNIREAHHDEPEEIHQHGDVKGIGDMTVLGHYRFVKLKEDKFETSALLGIKVPTGTTNRKDINGERFETEHQPGSGSWDPMIGMAVTKRFDSLSLDANVLYAFSTEGAQDTDLGDTFHYNGALAYRAVKGRPSFDLVLEANGEWKAEQKIRGVTDENSGGHTLFLSPGVRLSFDSAWSVYLAAGVPVIQELNGVQTDTRLRTSLGVSISF